MQFLNILIFIANILLMFTDSKELPSDMKEKRVHANKSFKKYPRSESDNALGSCIELFMGDAFGSGWKNARLYIYDDEGDFDSYAPSRTNNHTSVEYCFSAKEKVLSRTIVGSHIEKKSYPHRNIILSIVMQYFYAVNPQSMIWTVKNLNTGDYYTGNHLTRMVFRFRENSITLGYAQNLLSSRLNPAKCQSCIVENQKYLLTSHSKHHHQSLIQEYDETGFHGKYPDGLQSDMILYGYDNTWFRSDGFGTTYEITDVGGAQVFYAGQLCSGDIGDQTCPIVLPAGEYVWRVNGALDPHRDMVAWQFCSSSGGAHTELFFHIDQDGNCHPGTLTCATHEETMSSEKTMFSLPFPRLNLSLSSSPSAQTDLTPSTVLLKGVVDLTGSQAITMTDEDKLLLEEVLHTLFEEAKTTTLYSPVHHVHNATDMNKSSSKLLSWQEIRPESQLRKGRQENLMITNRIAFIIEIFREEYLLPGLNITSISQTILLSNFKRYIGIALESGEFLSQLHKEKNSNLNIINHGSLVDLEITEIQQSMNLQMFQLYILLAVCLGSGLGMAQFFYRLSTIKNSV